MKIKQEKTIIAAGGVVYRKINKIEEIIICKRTKANLYALPKGKREIGEDLESTALREVEEETGLQCKINKSIGMIEYLVPQGGEYFPKEVTFFLMETTGGKLEFHDHEFDEVSWMNIHKGLNILTFQSESDIVNKVLSGAKSI
jgi:8-oxo-dGTP pyrophosphatase MutT (NUDIX family)